LAISQEKEKKTDFVSDLIRASSFAEMYVDMAVSSVIDNYESEIRNSLIYSFTDKILYSLRVNDKTYISYIEIAPSLLANTYATTYDKKAFK